MIIDLACLVQRETASAETDSFRNKAIGIAFNFADRLSLSVRKTGLW
jgi:hypothetical protein